MNTSLYVEKLTQICLFFSMTLTFSTNCLFFSFFFPLWFDVHHSITDHRNIHFLFYFIFENLWEAGQFLIFFYNKSMSMAVFLSSFNTGAIYHLELSGNLCFWWLTDNSLFLSRCVPAMPCFVHSNVRLGLDCFIHVQSCLRLFNSGLKLFNSVAKLFEAQSGPSPIWMCLFNFVLFFFQRIQSNHRIVCDEWTACNLWCVYMLVFLRGCGITWLWTFVIWASSDFSDSLSLSLLF